MATLVTFNPDNYSEDQAGFEQAQKDGALYPVQIDGFESYSGMYNTQIAVFATAKMLGGKVCLGAYNKDNQFATMGDMDDVATCEENPVDWQSLDEAIEYAIKRRAALQYKHAQIAISGFKSAGFPLPESMTSKELVALGKAMEEKVSLDEDAYAFYKGSEWTIYTKEDVVIRREPFKGVLPVLYPDA